MAQTTSIRFIIPTNLLAAAALCVAKNDVRYYLGGVCIECAPCGTFGTVAATNGLVLFCARFATEKGRGEATLSAPAIVPAALLQGIGGKAGSFTDKFADIVIEDGSARVLHQDVSRSAKLIEGSFPNWRAVVPATTSGVAGNYNPALVQQLARVAKAVGVAYPCLHQNGDDAALCNLTDDAFLVLMPWRTHGPAQAPAWAQPRKADAEVGHG